MNVREMLEEIPRRYPRAKLREGFPEPPFRYFQVTFENNWLIGVGYDDVHYSSSRLGIHSNPLESTQVEVVIFKPNGDWYIAEGMNVVPGRHIGVLPFQDSDQLFRILDYIERKE